MKPTPTKNPNSAGTDNRVPSEARGHLRLSHTALLLLLLCAFGPASWAQPMLPPGTLVNAADYTFDLSPGAIGAIFGERLSTGFESAQSLPLPTSIGGTSVEATDGIRTMLLPLFMVSAGQINVQVPYGMGPDLTIRVTSPEGESNPTSLSLAPRSPKLFTWDQSGRGSAVVSHSSDSVVADRDRPVTPGEWITIWANGFGEVDPPVPAGSAPNDGSEGHPLHRVTAVVSVVINGQPADVSYAGLVPSQAGLYQVNAFTPHLDRVGDLDIAVTVDGISTQAGLTIPVQANGFYWVLGAGKFPNGQTRTAASGLESAIAFLHDDRASWGEGSYRQWSAAPGLDSTQLATSGVALTLRNGGAIVYDNNGIEDGAHNGHYANTVAGQSDSETAGLTAWFSQSTNYRAVTAGHFRLEQPTTFDQVIAYFDGNGDSALPLDPANSYNQFRVNI